LVFVLVFRPLLFVQVHVLKRKGRMKPAITAQFFLIAYPAVLSKSLGRVRICGVEQPI